MLTHIIFMGEEMILPLSFCVQFLVAQQGSNSTKIKDKSQQPLSLSVTPSHLLFLPLFITFLDGLRQCKSTLRQKELLNLFL